MGIGAAEEVGAGLAEVVGAVADFGEHLERDFEQVADVGIPGAEVDVVEQGAGGVGGVGDVAGAAGELPDQVAVDGAEEELAAAGALAGAVVGVEEPGELGAGEVGVEEEAGALGDERFVAGGAELGAHGAGAAVLPDDGAGERAAGLALPDQRRLALVGDADRGDVGGGDAGALDGAAAGGGDGGPDVVGVVLDPARVGEVLRELLLGAGDRLHPLVEDDRPARGGALVDGEDVAHASLPPLARTPAGFRPRVPAPAAVSRRRPCFAAAPRPCTGDGSPPRQPLAHPQRARRSRPRLVRL